MTLLITGKSQLDKEKIKHFLALKNPHAPLWVVDLYYDLEPKWGIRADVLLCQMFHETGYLTSWWCGAPRYNMAGVGVTGETSSTQKAGYVYEAASRLFRKGYQYGSLTYGVLGHFAHMSAYVFRNEINNASTLDERYQVARKALGNLVITELSALDGRWATGFGYSAKIESIFNTIKTN
jgi:hypothetical protein